MRVVCARAENDSMVLSFSIYRDIQISVVDVNRCVTSKSRLQKMMHLTRPAQATMQERSLGRHQELNVRENKLAVFGAGSLVGIVGGLIGPGGAEFRLPLLIGLFRFGALEAVIVNKATSLFVVATALPFRTATIPLTDVAAQWPIILNLLAGSLLGAWFGAGLATRFEIRHPPQGYRPVAGGDCDSPRAWSRNGIGGGLCADGHVAHRCRLNRGILYRGRRSPVGCCRRRTPHSDACSAVRRRHKVGGKPVSGREFADNDRWIHPLQPRSASPSSRETRHSS